ncbi:type IV pilus biogenesis protein PilP [Citrobacter koseri]|uniref:type IV pilus biogenesis protein PilP n=1 Tax=Citrobacter koseri TaxID=545 RepID=UPI000E074AA7|nr:type IV pilus biogenesis protein PilP [Citrobacter koseri]STB73356.1 type IV pilus biogenesis protein PilP [Citrobacter koseri]STT23535.1 type IV pilus biogenesis protein PilP [Citrobacter koseri]
MQKNNALRWLLPCGITLLALTSQAYADESMTINRVIPENVVSGELELAQARNMVLEQQVQTARLQQQLRQAQAPAETKSWAEGAPAGYPRASVVEAPQTQAPAVSSVSRAPERVRLQEIYGKPGSLLARITLPGGGVTEVKKGDVIPGMKGTVASISGESVRLSDGRDLTF